MGPAIPAAIAGGASILGGILGNRASAREGRRNREFQERMRNTQWQAAVADLEAAGLNPAVAYSRGPNAAPGGSMAAQSDVISPGVSNAMAARRMAADLKLLEQQTIAARAQAKKTQHEASIAANDDARATAQYAYYFTPDGWLKPPMLELLRAEHGARMATSARSVTDLEMARLGLPERKAIAALFERLGESGKGVQLALPMILRALGR